MHSKGNKSYLVFYMDCVCVNVSVTQQIQHSFFIPHISFFICCLLAVLRGGAPVFFCKPAEVVGIPHARENAIVCRCYKTNLTGDDEMYYLKDKSS